MREIRLPPVALPADELWASLERELAAADKQLFLEHLRHERVPRNDEFPQIAGLLVDDQGLLWIKRYDHHKDSIWLRKHARWPAPGGEWAVVRPDDGSIVARVELPAGVRPLQIDSDRILGVAVDALGVERVVVHQIVR